MEFEALEISVPELTPALEQFQQWFCSEPMAKGQRSINDETMAWATFQLPFCHIDLVEDKSIDKPYISALRIVDPLISNADTDVQISLAVDADALAGNKLQAQAKLISKPVRIFIQNQSLLREPVREEIAVGIHKIDHIVVRDQNADELIHLFRDQLGMRLALDQTVEAWGGRMLFFRAAKITVECIVSARDEPQVPEYWGVAFAIHHLSDYLRVLSSNGVETSPIRSGRKPDTEVATLKSHHYKLPILFIS